MRSYGPTLLIALLLTVVWSPVVQAVGYIKFDGIDGECTDAEHQGWSDLASFQIDISRNFDGGALGRVEASMKFSMVADSAYPYVFENLLRGMTYDTLTIEQFDGRQLVDRYEFEQAITPSLSTLYSGGAPARINGTIATRELTLNHFVYDDRTGALVETIEVNYDFTNVSALTAGTLPGDYNFDGVVDFDDYDKWKDQFGGITVPIGSGADGNADGQVDLGDYTLWRDNLGRSLATSIASQSVPEPASLAIGALGLAVVLGIRRSRAGVV
ncbi:type VI secretion system tube protein Hcp [Aeoliella mucimassa]|uniref:Ice-binding protein C-terminal domain-containing protein n=1 Tax=Aeoliella mucimassa TaxID=2527972 RepID=A0A518AW20_9BACT|nr:type VI secretion system tube protein Hcp [Aeoliella mucimassa]QDU58935.1 hypothetical protein Pan181_51760 [Aeoliella mucimassa]